MRTKNSQNWPTDILKPKAQALTINQDCGSLIEFHFKRKGNIMNVNKSEAGDGQDA